MDLIESGTEAMIRPNLNKLLDKPVIYFKLVHHVL